MRGSQSPRSEGARGQALLMVTMGITFLLGLLGLVVDVGYGYYVKQVAQAAVDSAAIAAVVAATSTSGACGTAVLCNATPTNCSASPTYPPATDFDSACLYAKKNGFTNSGAQTVKFRRERERHRRLPESTQRIGSPSLRPNGNILDSCPSWVYTAALSRRKPPVL